ncbi:MAG: galactose mutarotase [Rhodobacterales bacterium]|nr:galactose mutarotase [Rhodobacterales bacterium]
MAQIGLFGTGRDGRSVQAVRLQGGGLRVTVLTRGAILQDLRLDGDDRPLVLGSSQLAAYEGPMAWFGAVVGPVANRIGGAQAVIDGVPYRFAPNEGTILLHGGAAGTHARLWRIAQATADAVTLALDLPHMCDGFPGGRRLTARYAITGPGRLAVDLTAETDAPTLMNLACHPYVNLGDGRSLAGHRLTVQADRYLPTRDGLPTGGPVPVGGAFDLRVGRDLTAAAGLDHNFCLADAPRPLTPVAVLSGPDGLRLRLATTAPGLQVYDGAHLDTAPLAGHGGAPYGPHAGLALEPQAWPDAPNHAGFPPVLLRPGQLWQQSSHWDFDRI